MNAVQQKFSVAKKENRSTDLFCVLRLNHLLNAMNSPNLSAVPLFLLKTRLSLFVDSETEYVSNTIDDIHEH